MARSTALCWGLIVAFASLAAAVAVYDLARALPPDILARFQVSDRFAPLPAWLADSAPSLLFTLALGTLIGLVAAPATALRHVGAWLAIALALELAQLPAAATRAAACLAEILPEPVWRITASYWTAGTFDPSDLAATAVGGVLALFITRRVATGAWR